MEKKSLMRNCYVLSLIITVCNLLSLVLTSDARRRKRKHKRKRTEGFDILASACVCLASQSFLLVQGNNEKNKRKVLGSCGLEVTPVAVFPFDKVYGGQEAIQGDITSILSSVDKTQGPSGEENGALMLHGTPNSYIEIPANKRLDVRWSITILCNLYPITGGLAPIVNYKPNGHGVQIWTNGVQNGKGVLTARFNQRSLMRTQFLTSTVLNLNQWNFIGASYDYVTGAATLWHDGRAVLNTNIGASIELATQFAIRIGSLIVTHLGGYEGKISCLQFYSTVLTEEQIKAARDACSYVTPVSSLSIEVSPRSSTVQINTTISIAAFIQDGKNDAHFSFDFDDGGHVQQDFNNTAMHTYKQAGVYVIVVRATDKCNHSNPLSVNRKITVTSPLTELSGLVILASPTKMGQIANISLVFPVQSIFNCSLDFGDGVSQTILSSLISIKSATVGHRYLSVGYYNISSVCWNPISSCNASRVISVQRPIQDLHVYPIPPSMNGSDITFKWSISEGSNVDYEANVDGKPLIPVFTSKDGMQGHATILPSHYGSIGRHLVTIVAKNDVTHPILRTQVFLVLSEVAPFDVAVVSSNGIFTVNDTITLNINSSTHAQFESLFYRIDFGDESPHVVTNRSAVNHTYVQLGCHVINVTGLNAVSSRSVVKEVCLESRVTPLSGLTIETKPVEVGENASIILRLVKGSHFECLISFSHSDDIRNETRKQQNAASESQHTLIVSRIFHVEGIYHFQARCWNKISELTTTSKVIVQHEIRGFFLHPMQPQEYGSNITIKWEITQGTNVTYTVTFQSRHLDYKSRGNSSIAVMTVDDYFEEGCFNVTVTAENHVTLPRSLSQIILIQKPITKVDTSVFYMKESLEYPGYGKQMNHFPLGVQLIVRSSVHLNSKSVKLTYHFNGMAMDKWANKKVLPLPALPTGQYNLSVTASNNVSHARSVTQIFIQEKVAFAEKVLLCTSQMVINEKGRIRFMMARLTSDACLIVHIGNETVYHYGNKDCSLYRPNTSLASRVYIETMPTKYVDQYHTFTTLGKRLVKVALANTVSMEMLQCEVEVLRLACKAPTVTLRQIGTESSKPRIVTRSESFDIVSETSVFCPASKQTIFEWSIFKLGLSSNVSRKINMIDLGIDFNLPTLHIQERQLSLGLYHVKLTVRMSEEWLRKYSAEASGFLEVGAPDLVAEISGGNLVRRGYGPAVIVNGSSSYDPDVGYNKHAGMSFLWLCRNINGTFPSRIPANPTSVFSAPNQASRDLMDDHGSCYRHNASYIVETNKTSFILNTSRLEVGGVYVIMLIVWKEKRVSTVQQTIEIVAGEPPPIEIMCAENCKEKVNPSQRLALFSECKGPGCWGKLFYRWKIYTLIEENKWVEAKNNLTREPTTSGLLILVINKNTLEGDKQYKIEVSAQRGMGPQGLATRVLIVNSPPRDGQCDVTPRIGHVLMTRFSFRCFNWKDPDEPLSYQILFSRQQNEQTILYYGGKAEIAEGLPLGDEKRNFTLDIEILVSDRLGANTAVYLRVQSRPPHQDSALLMTELTSMTSGNNSLLDSLKKSGKLQALALTISTASSLLNFQSEQPTKEDDEKEERAKKSQEIRAQMINSLHEIKAMNLESLTQVTNALTQTTKIANEIQPQAQVLSANILINLGQLLNKQAYQDTNFDTLKSSTASYLTALDGVLRMVSITAAARPVSGSTHTTHVRNVNEAVDAQAKDSAISLAGSISHVTKGLLQRKLPNEQATMFVTPGMRASLKRISLDQGLGDDLSLGNEGTFVASIGEELMKMRMVDNKTTLDREVFTFNQNIYSWDKTSPKITSPVMSLSFAINSKPLAITGLKKPVELFMKRSPELPAMESFHLNSNSSWNFHKLEITSVDDSVYIEVFLKKCDQQFQVFVRKDFQPTFENFDWSNKTLTRKSSYYKSHSTCADSVATLFLSNKNLSRGVYFVGITVNGSDVSSNASVEYKMRTLVSKCLFWSVKEERWKGDGCWGGPMTNGTHIQCLTSHLTSFGMGMFVAPNPISFSRVMIGFKEAFKTGNVVVLFSVIGLFLLYALLAVWARRVDKKDQTEMTSVLLPPITDTFTYKYEVTIVTGSRGSAGTTANVFCDIYGENGTTGVYPLLVPNNKGFPRRSIRTFVLSTPASIGTIEGIRIWHDCYGRSPSWFLRKILVLDPQTDEKWAFNVGRWLALDVGDGEVEAFIKFNSPEDRSAFGNLFDAKLRRGICDKHIWFSLLFRPQWSPFTRLQRLSCCLSLLCSTMIASAMFYGAGPEVGDTSGDIIIGPIRLNLKMIVIGVQSALIVLPVNLLIVGIFRNLRPKGCQLGKETEAENRKQQNVSAQKSKKNFSTSCSCNGVDDDTDLQLQHHEEGLDVVEQDDILDVEDVKMDGGLENRDNPRGAEDIDERLEEQDELKEHRGWCCTWLGKQAARISSYKFPYWCIYLAWFLCITTSVTSSLFVIFYSMMWGKTKSNQWLTSMYVSFVQDTLVSQPIKVLVTALVFALIIRKATDDEDIKTTRKTETIPPENQPDYSDPTQEESAPLDQTTVKKLRDQQLKIDGFKKILLDFCYYLLVLVAVSLVSHKYRSSDTADIKKTMEMVFVRPAAGLDRMGTSEVSDIKSLWQWTNHTLVGGINDKLGQDYQTGLSNVGMKVLHARLRQVRVKDEPCTITGCRTYYSPKHEDKKSYQAGWREVDNTLIKQGNTPWIYRTPEESNHTLQVSGIHADYTGGGYSADLRKDIVGSRAVVNQLADSSWLDQSTRAFFGEFNVYSPNSNLIAIVTCLFEMPSYGGVVASLRTASNKLSSPEFSASDMGEIIMILLVFVMFIRLFLAIFHQKLKFFYSVSNISDLAFVVVGLAVLVWRVVITNTQATQRRLFLESRDSFIDFYKCGGYADMATNTFAFWFFIAVARFSAFLSLFRCVQEFFRTLAKSLEQFGNLLIILALLIIAYSSLFVLAFADQLDDFQNFSFASRTLFSFILSNLSGREIGDPKTLFLMTVCTYSFSMMFLMLNLFRSILGENHKRTREKSRHEENTNLVESILIFFKAEILGKSKGLIVKRRRKSESELRLEAQLRYVVNNQSVRITKHLNELYLEDYNDDVLILKNFISAGEDKDVACHFNSAKF